MNKQNPPGLTRFACRLADEFLQTAATDDKNINGLDFTPEWVAEIMARQIQLNTANIYLLDPGAGIGVLTAAVCEQLIQSTSPLKIHADVVENNLSLIPYLQETLHKIEQACTDSPHEFSCQLTKKDFIVEHAQVIQTSPLFANKRTFSKYDVIIAHPPFYKQAELNQQLKIVNQFIHAQSNTFAFFLAFSRQLLKINGQMVVLMPRTCCSGLYYKAFRKWFMEQMKIEQIHLFPPDREEFQERFYQENVILKFRKTQKALSEIKISASLNQNLPTRREFFAGYSSLVQPRDPDRIIPIPVNSLEFAIVKYVRSWGQQLRQLGYQAASGQLDLRDVTGLLIPEKKNDAPDSTAILGPHHLQKFAIVYPVADAPVDQGIRLNPQSNPCLTKNQRYVLIRRFNRKKLPRCIEAGYYAPALINAPEIGIMKSLLYIRKQRGKLSLLESLGIMALLNSDLINRYLYVVNGIRKVSASELNKLPFPDYNKILQIGEKINQFRQLELSQINSIVFEIIDLSAELQTYLLSAR